MGWLLLALSLKREELKEEQEERRKIIFSGKDRMILGNSQRIPYFLRETLKICENFSANDEEKK